MHAVQAVDGAVDEPGADDRGGAGDGEVQGHLGLPAGAAAGGHCWSCNLHRHQALMHRVPVPQIAGALNAKVLKFNDKGGEGFRS